MYPERLMSAAPCAAGWEPPEAGAPIREEIASSLERGDGFGPIIRLFAPGGKEPNPVRMWWTNRMLLRWNDPVALAHSLRAMRDLMVTEEQLRANQVPALTIMGTEDPLRPGVDRMKGVMANHKIVFVDGKDHLTTLTSPVMKEALLAFLKGHSGTAVAGQPADQQAAQQELNPAA
jgi:pimeloyl-ACP methyl ester carboxylesterase